MDRRGGVMMATSLLQGMDDATYAMSALLYLFARRALESLHMRAVFGLKMGLTVVISRYGHCQGGRALRKQ